MVVALTHSEYGDGDPPLVIVHGLFGSRRNWSTVAKRVCTSRRIYTLDLRNHGQSPWAESMDYDDHVGDLREFMLARGLRQVSLLGHSMGGKCAMWLAYRYPSAIKSLVIVDIAPVRYAHDVGSYVHAMQQMDVSTITRRSDADAMLRPQIQDPAMRSFLLQNLIFEDGHYRWRINLSAIKDNLDIISGFPPLPTGALYRGPTLFLFGETSQYVSASDQDLISRLFPRVDFKCIPQAGHWLHTEQPDRFIRAVQEFLGLHDSNG